MAEVLAVRAEYRLQQWMQIFEERRDSGLSNRQFCKQKHICEKTYYYWLRKVREAAIQQADNQPKLVPLNSESSQTCATEQDVLHIQFRGAELKLPSCVDMDAVAALLRSIQTYD